MDQTGWILTGKRAEHARVAQDFEAPSPGRKTRENPEMTEHCIDCQLGMGSGFPSHEVSSHNIVLNVM